MAVFTRLKSIAEVDAALLHMNALREQMKALREELADYEVAVKAYMLESQLTLFATDHVRASYTKMTAKRFDVKRFAEERPKMYERYVVAKPSERFTFGLKGQKKEETT